MVYNGQNSSTISTFVFATLFLLAALALTATSFATTHWIDTYVDRDELEEQGVETELMKDTGVFYPSARGLLRTCYPTTATFLDLQDNLVDGECLTEQGYELPKRREESFQFGEDYNLHIHLIRAHFAAMCVAMLFYLICCVVAIMGCWNNSANTLRSAGVLTFIGMFFGAAGMALFHGYTYLEDNILEQMTFSNAWIDQQARISTDWAYLLDNRVSTYGYSYILGWLALAMGTLAGILFLVVAYKYLERKQKKYGRKKHHHHHHQNNDYDHHPYNDDYYRQTASSGGGYAYADPSGYAGYNDNPSYDYAAYPY